MDPQLRRPLYVVLALAALGVTVYATLQTDVDGGREDGTAGALGAVASRLAVGLAVAFGVRAIVRRAPANRTFGTAAAAVCCGALLGLGLTTLILGLQKGQRGAARDGVLGTAVSETRACTAREGDPLARGRAPFDLTAFTDHERAQLLSERQDGTPELLRFAHAFRDGQLIGRVTATALRPGTLDGDDYLTAARQSLAAAGGAPRDERLAGVDVVSGDIADGAVIAGAIDCGALAIEVASRKDARALWTMLVKG